jgi:hypothetical protein
MSKYDFIADGVKFIRERRVDCSTSKCDAYGATKKGRDIVPALQGWRLPFTDFVGDQLRWVCPVSE